MIGCLIRAELFLGQLSDSLPMCAVGCLLLSIYLKIRRQARLADYFFWVSLLNLGMTLAVSYTLNFAARSGTRYDLYVNNLDRLMGCPSNFLNRIISGSFLITSAAYLDYLFYWVLIIAVLYLAAKENLTSGWEAFLRFILAGAFALPIFLLFPVSGPKYIEGFPTVYSGPVHSLSIAAPPNCIPSVHFSVALMIFWGLRKSRAGFIVGSIHVLLTIVATLGFGLHYAFDLIVAIPFTALVLSVPIPLSNWMFARNEATD